MDFKEWRVWFRELPWLLKWFPLVILLRPLIDNLFFLKEISPFLSPPYIVGVLTPLVCVAAVIKYKLPDFNASDKIYSLWSILLCLCSLMVFIQDPLSLMSIEFVLKLLMPVYLFFFLRIFLRDLSDLHGLLNSFLYSGIFVAVLLLYEVLVNPIGVQESRGLTRIQGSFGDVVSYGMYIVFATLISAYYYKARQHLVSSRKLIGLLGVVAGLSILALINIHHTATYIVYILLIGLFTLYSFQTKNEGLGITVLLLAGFGFVFFGSVLIAEKITPLVETDIAVYQGVKESDQLLHGRVGRWRFMLNSFFNEPPHVQFLGLPVSLKPAFAYIGIGSHNDFFRILFATGYLGLFFYLFFLYLIHTKARRFAPAQRLLVFGSGIALLFYSISITPTFYPPFLYFILTILAFVLLPETKRSSWKGIPY